MRNPLGPGGRFAVSFLEFAIPQHWAQFRVSMDYKARGEGRAMTTFIEREPLTLWANRIGFDVVEFVDGNKPAWNGRALGQSVAILRKAS